MPSNKETRLMRMLRTGNPWRVIFPGIVLFVIALVCLFWSFSHSDKPGEQLEIARANLISKEGRLYQKGASKPFRGLMIEFYLDGSVQSRSMISNGQLEGISEGFYTNGQIQVREFFRAGVSHGQRTKWHANGVISSEAMVVEGKLQGTLRRWYENGTLAEQIELEEGKPNGLSRAYYPSGFLKAQATLQDGNVTEQTFWDDGQERVPPAAAVNLASEDSR